MEKTLKQIREYFAPQKDGLRPIDTLGKQNIAYTIRMGQEYGVAIPFDNPLEIAEESSNIVFRTRHLLVNGNSCKFLVLTCIDEEYRNEFAELCTQFVIPGENEHTRYTLLHNPYVWWDHWVNLLGDRKSNRKCYDVMGELYALNILFSHNLNLTWSASHAGSHDIETDDRSYEVKSTIKKRESCVTISSQFQMASDKQLNLIFLRLEESTLGYSINDMADRLEKNGYDRNLLESQLNDRGFIRGSRLRDVKYKVLEGRIYDVDDKFPKITNQSFKGDLFPSNITKIMYTIDLEGIGYTNFQ